MIYNIRYTANRDRELALAHLNTLEASAGRKLRVLDIGGWHNQWAPQYVTEVIDIFEVPNVKVHQGNINMPTIWNTIMAEVEINGLFDFCICTHTLEDIANPGLAIEFMPKIAKEGFIAIPSKFAEARFNQYGFRGSIHHRWIFNQEDSKIVAYPKINYLERSPISDQLAHHFNPSTNEELQFFWKTELPIEFVNGDYLGPSDQAVMMYYDNLVRF
jgi:hypothetical protein